MNVTAACRGIRHRLGDAEGPPASQTCQTPTPRPCGSFPVTVARLVAQLSHEDSPTARAADVTGPGGHRIDPSHDTGGLAVSPAKSPDRRRAPAEGGPV